jgi:endonuclease YncB( thermonuclease family)
MRWLLLLAFLPFPALAETRTGSAYVIDGDTIAIDKARLRLLNMDAFEAAQNCQKSGKSYSCEFEATLALADMVRGKQVRCEGDKRDRYGRPLVHCWIGPVDLGRQMVRLGWALAEFGDEYREDEALAQSIKIGAWDGSFQRPKEWRGPPLVELYYL